MPLPAFLLPSIAGALIAVASSVVGRVLIALGIGVVAYTGINATLGYFSDVFTSAANSTGADVIGIIYLLKLDAVVSIYTAAGLARFAISGAISGSIKRMTLR